MAAGDPQRGHAVKAGSGTTLMKILVDDEAYGVRLGSCARHLCGGSPDHVMERDRRARWMRHWLLGTHCIQTLEVFERREPVLLVANDPDDGLWQLIGTTDAGSTGKIGHLHHAIDEDPTLIEVLDLLSGHRASRTRIGGPWTRHHGRPA